MTMGSTLFGPDAHAHLYEIYDDLRSTDPVHWADPPGVWLLTRYSDVVTAVRDPRLISGWPGVLLAQLPSAVPDEVRAYYSTMTKMLIFIDPPHHSRVRRTMSKAFTPRVAESMRSASQRCVDRLLDEVADREEMDLMRDLAYPFPLLMICDMLGVRPEDRAQFKAWSDDLAVVLLNPAASAPQVVQAYRSLSNLMAYFAHAIAERQIQPKDDVLQQLIAAHAQEYSLGEEELLVTCSGLLFAGHETTTNVIGNGLCALLHHPDQMRRLRDEPSLIGRAVDELLRYDGPAQTLIRLAVQDLDIGGKRIAQGQSVVLLLGAANRDPARFPEPDRLDLSRGDKGHVGFGMGRHACLGSALGQMEAEIAILRVLQRMPGLRLTTDAVTWNESLAIRGLTSLPVVF
jgi:cytochrome P450